MPTVRLEPSGAEFPVGTGESILTAALRHRISIRHGCRQGKCSLCKHWLVDGDVEDSRASVYALTRADRANGAILLCCAHALSDLIIELDDETEAEELPPLEPPSSRIGTVVEQRSLTQNLTELRLRLDQSLSFRAGQYAELSLAASGLSRPYSILNAPASALELTFCVKRIPGGAFSSHLSQLTPGTTLNVHGPFGTMFLRKSGRPVIAAATGSGIAPILSILGDAADSGLDVAIRFYYGAVSAADLSYLDLLDEFAQRLPDFQFVPCLSHGETATVSNAREGRITRVIASDIGDASGYDAYLCGAPDMCNTIGELLELKGLSANRVHTDAFYAAAPPSADQGAAVRR